MTDAIDEAALMDLVGGDRMLAGELAQLFLNDLGPRITEITGSIAEGHAARLREAAHSLRGSASSLRAKGVSAASGVLEAIAASGSLDGAGDALTVLNVALASLRPRLVALTGAA